MSPERRWTVLELLRWTAEFFARKGIESARLDAECLLAHALGCDRLRLYVEFDKPVQAAERTRFRELVRRRAEERIPVAYLVGKREFWSLPIEVTPEVLVPRPETETLVAAALDRFPEPEAELRVLDVGTGSGCVALALASERPKARVTGTDVAWAALEVARRNGRALGLEARLRWLEGAFFEPVAGERFDLVVSNPPYLAEGELAGLAPELAHEPRAALVAGPEGTEVLEQLVRQVRDHLEPGGVVALEVAPGQARRVAGWLAEAGLVDVAVRSDLGRRPRVVSARREGGA